MPILAQHYTVLAVDLPGTASAIRHQRRMSIVG